MYQEIILRPSGLAEKRIYPDQAQALARVMIASALGDAPVHPALFNRDSSGRCLQGRIGDDRNGEGYGAAPLIAFDGGVGFIRLFGFGAEGSRILIDSSPALVHAVSAKYGPTAVALHASVLKIRPTGHGVAHRIRRVVVSKKAGRRVDGPVSDPDVARILRRHIVSGLTAQSMQFAPQMLGHIPDEDAIEILDGVPIPIATHHGITVSAYKNVAVSMPVRLVGPWLVGHLRSAGYGYIRAVDPTRGDN